MDTKQFISDNKIVAILRRIPSDKLLDLVDAIYAGGIRCIEVTVDQQGEISDTTHAIERIRNAFDGRICVGAGTVMTPDQARSVAAAGASYMISPNYDRAVIETTKELGLVSMPGALTPSEIAAAYSFGADFVKVFPASVFGPSYFKAVKAPMPQIPLMAVGGVTPETARSYMEAGASGIGIAGGVVNRAWIDQNRFDEVTREAKRYVEAIR